MDTVTALLEKNGLVFAFLVVGQLMVASNYASAKLTRGRLLGSAIAIIVGLLLAYLGGRYAGGDQGLADVAVFAEITSGWSLTAP